MAEERVMAFLSLVLLGVAAVADAGNQARNTEGVISKDSMAEYLAADSGKIEPPPEKNATPLQIYLHLLRLKRREQVETVEKVLGLQDYSRQFKTVAMLLDTLFPAIEESMSKIETAGLSPAMPFPEDRELQEEVGRVYENILMFGDFVLRLPEITKKVYGRHTEWTGLFRWALKFCLKSTDVFTGPYATHLELMKQELGMGPKDPNYTNPFWTKEKEESVKDRVQSRREAMQEKMKSTKGPRLKTNRHNEL